jgi:hypothetical protein
MHVSDILLECAKECARLSRECGDEPIAAALFEISGRLLSAATCDAELLMEDAQAMPRAGPQPPESNSINQNLLAGA